MANKVFPPDDPTRLAYYRRVKDCEPVLDYAEARTKIAALRAAAERLDAAMEEFLFVSSELVDLGVGETPTFLEFAFWKLAKRPEPWMTPREAIKDKGSREQWTSMPDEANALFVWHRFSKALAAEPVRIYRTTFKRENEWEAEFRRRDGSSMFVGLIDLAGPPRKPITEGTFGADKSAEIVDRIAEWVENESVTAPV